MSSYEIAMQSIVVKIFRIDFRFATVTNIDSQIKYFEKKNTTKELFRSIRGRMFIRGGECKIP